MSIVVQDLCRVYGSLRAVDGVNFEVPSGTVCGFVGANGAGKTTTMRILATLDYPTRGKAEICGFNVVHHPYKVRSLIGWMPDHFGNYSHVTVLEYLDFFARALNFKKEERRARVEEVINFTELFPLADRFSNKLSKGQTQRLGLARALLHDPQVLIMDEPAAGLDPKARVELKHLIRLLAKEGKTLLISSHILSELGEMCDTLLFLNDGKIVHHGDAESLKKSTDLRGGVLYNVQLQGETHSISDWATLTPGVDIIETTKRGARLRIADVAPENITRMLSKMLKEGLPIIDFHREERNLEDAFIDIISNLNEGVAPLQPTDSEASQTEGGDEKEIEPTLALSSGEKST